MKTRIRVQDGKRSGYYNLLLSGVDRVMTISHC
jgi:hypothetical protein